MHGAAALFTHGSQFNNDVAAMPSLHAAYPMLILLFFWSRARRWVRALLVSYTLAMAFTLVNAGEHFVIDEIFGWGLAAAVYFGAHGCWTGGTPADWAATARRLPPPSTRWHPLPPGDGGTQ